MIQSASYCHPLPPLLAFGSDFPQPTADEQESRLLDWLHAGVCMWRIVQMDAADRPAAFRSAGDVLATCARRSRDHEGHDSLEHGASSSSITTIATWLSEAAAHPADVSAWSPPLARAVRDGAEYLEQRGAFRLAYTLLASLRKAITQLAPADVGRALVLQGRLARQLGALHTADDHYTLAERLGRTTADSDLYLRAVLGRGVIAATRGNYPQARTRFRQALRGAMKAGITEHIAAAHNALLMAAIAARDLDAALTHGWHAFLHSAMLPGRQAEILVNLAEVALLSGRAEAALAASTEALSLADSDRVRLAGAGTAAHAAARLGRRDVIDTVVSANTEVFLRSRQEFDKAFTLVEIAEAYTVVGARDRAVEFLARARAIADPAGFFELVHRADAVAQQLATGAVSPSIGEPVPRDEIKATTFTPADAGSSPANLSKASRRVLQSLAELRS